MGQQGEEVGISLKFKYQIKKILNLIDLGRKNREMSITSNKKFGFILSIVHILGLISCGGGGGGGDSVTVPSVPTGLTYTGVTSPATIDSNNAAELAIDAFMGGETGSNLGIFSSVSGITEI